jgi:hypothetical protein
MSTKTFIINGVEVPIDAVPQKNDSIGMLFTKQDRAVATINKHFTLQASIASQQQREFQVDNTPFNDYSIFMANFALVKSIEIMKKNLKNYDVLAVFNIVFPIIDSDDTFSSDLQTEIDSTGKSVIKSRCLIDDYRQISITDVANSSYFFTEHTHKFSQLHTDLSLFLSHILKTMLNRIYTKELMMQCLNFTHLLMAVLSYLKFL